MNKTIIAIALSSTIALAACGKSGDSEMSAPASSAAPVSEKSATGIVEKTAEVSKETWEKTKDAPVMRRTQLPQRVRKSTKTPRKRYQKPEL
ncbi:MAG: hypothetical protein KZQ73_10930 [Candidatus Thiodiazotropha sp. (ex Semelilucina semeliformis)]|nr:hypothetical protein [Candidatus Thiodiazotropha sp. (ex Semelilucina semeliformis)]